MDIARCDASRKFKAKKGEGFEKQINEPEPNGKNKITETCKHT
jgi:hypothetical protein